MYKLIIDNNTYYYDYLEEACDRFCLTLSKFNVLQYALTGEFKKTAFGYKDAKKIKRYCLSIDFPKLYLEIFKKDKTEMLPDLVFSVLKKYMEKYKCKYVT